MAHGQINHIEIPADAEPKQAIPGMGWFAVVHDREGNEVGLFQGAGAG